jgi:hypothetical protein
MRGRGVSRSLLALAVVVAMAIAGGVALRLAVGREPRPVAPEQVAAATSSSGEPGAARRPLRALDDDAERPEGDPLAKDEDGYVGSWEGVDLDAVKAALPDNIYWTMSSPTNDPAIIEWRRQERDRWNAEYGKVLSNTATDEEIDAYYGHRQQLSEDYLEFVVYVLEHHGYEIPKRDVALLKLAAEMHHARLEEIPRQLAEAKQRHAAHEQARQAWLAEQKAFTGDDGGAAPAGD